MRGRERSLLYYLSGQIYGLKSKAHHTPRTESLIECTKKKSDRFCVRTQIELNGTHVNEENKKQAENQNEMKYLVWKEILFRPKKTHTHTPTNTTRERERERPVDDDDDDDETKLSTQKKINIILHAISVRDK